MMIYRYLAKLIQRFRLWRCRRIFAGLPVKTQHLFTTMRIDPDSLVEKGAFGKVGQVGVSQGEDSNG